MSKAAAHFNGKKIYMIKNLDPEHADEPMDFERDLEVRIEQCANYDAEGQQQPLTPGDDDNILDADELEMGFSQICTDNSSPDKIKVTSANSMNISD